MGGEKGCYEVPDVVGLREAAEGVLVCILWLMRKCDNGGMGVRMCMFECMCGRYWFE